MISIFYLHECITHYFTRLRSFNCLYAKINCDYLTETKDHGESIKILQRILIGKILLLKAKILTKLNMDEECEAAFKKAITFNAGKLKNKHFLHYLVCSININD